MYINRDGIDKHLRDLEHYQRDWSKAKNTIETAKKQLAEFVLLNAELIATGEKIDLSAYSEAIEEAKFDIEWAEKSFNETKEHLANLVGTIQLFS